MGCEMSEQPIRERILQTGPAFWADCFGRMEEAGSSATRVEHLAGPDSMVLGIR